MLNNNQQYNKGKDIKLRTYNFSLHVLGFIKHLFKNYTGDIIGRQLLRSATSIGANIIEGQSSSSRREFKNFLNIALKSANETKYWLCLIKDGNLSKEKSKTEKLLQEAIEISKILASIQISLKKR